jgi:hypothetical protein
MIAVSLSRGNQEADRNWGLDYSAIFRLGNFDINDLTFVPVLGLPFIPLTS